jgi:hypothetical protein
MNDVDFGLDKFTYWQAFGPLATHGAADAGRPKLNQLDTDAIREQRCGRQEISALATLRHTELATGT